MSVQVKYGGAVALALIVFALAFSFRDDLARYGWSEWHAGALALALDGHDPELAIEIGNYYFGTAPLGDAEPAYDPALAEQAFEKALAIQPGILWGHYQLARIYFARGDFNAALAEANAELAANPDNLRTLYVRGLIYGFRGGPNDLASAEDDLLRFVAWAPTEWAGYNDLAWILLKEQKYQEVLSVLQTAFSKVPDAEKNAWLLNDRGLALMHLGERAAAAIAFSQANVAAEALTESEWRAAYTGDSPEEDQAGLAAFRAGIQANLQKVAPAD